MNGSVTVLREHSIAAIVLAAGRGTRMGGRSKLLLPMPDGRPIVWHAVQGALRFRPLETLVVVQPGDERIPTALEGLPVRLVPNPRYVEGMGTSLATGVAALSPETKGALVLLGDEPQVSPHIVARLLETYLHECKPITIPRYGDQFGPPTLFSAAAFPLLATLKGDVGGRQLVARHPDLASIVPFPATDRPHDIDTREDYEGLGRENEKRET